MQRISGPGLISLKTGHNTAMPTPSQKPASTPAKPDFFMLCRDICLHPRQTIRKIIDQDPTMMHRDMIIAVSVTSGLLAFRGGTEMMFLEFGLNLVLLVVSIYSTALLVWLTGKPLGGKGTFVQICAAIIWPMSPTLAATIVAFGMMMFTESFLPDIVQMLGLLFSFHLMNGTLAEVQHMSAWNSFCNQVLAIVIPLMPFFFFWDNLVAQVRLLGAF
jgi:hypothetical protein